MAQATLFGPKARKAFAYIPPNQPLEKCSLNYLWDKLVEVETRLEDTQGYHAQRYLLTESEKLQAAIKTKMKRERLKKIFTLGLL